MPKISVKEIRNVAKTALLQHGALDWVSEEVADHHIVSLAVPLCRGLSVI